VAADPIPSLALKMASNILVFNSKLYKESKFRQLKLASRLSALIVTNELHRISNPLLSLITKILILDTDNEEFMVLQNECKFMSRLKGLMDFFRDNSEVLENLADIVEVLLKKAHADNLNGEFKRQVVELGYNLFEYMFGFLEER